MNLNLIGRNEINSAEPFTEEHSRLSTLVMLSDLNVTGAGTLTVTGPSLSGDGKLPNATSVAVEAVAKVTLNLDESGIFEANGGALNDTNSYLVSKGILVVSGLEVNSGTMNAFGGSISAANRPGESTGFAADFNSTININGGALNAKAGSITAESFHAAGMSAYSTVNVTGGKLTAEAFENGKRDLSSYGLSSHLLNVSGTGIVEAYAGEHGIGAKLDAVSVKDNGMLVAAGKGHAGYYKSVIADVKGSAVYKDTSFQAVTMDANGSPILAGGENALTARLTRYPGTSYPIAYVYDETTSSGKLVNYTTKEKITIDGCDAEGTPGTIGLSNANIISDAPSGLIIDYTLPNGEKPTVRIALGQGKSTIEGGAYNGDTFGINNVSGYNIVIGGNANLTVTSGKSTAEKAKSAGIYMPAGSTVKIEAPSNGEGEIRFIGGDADGTVGASSYGMELSDGQQLTGSAGTFITGGTATSASGNSVSAGLFCNATNGKLDFDAGAFTLKGGKADYSYGILAPDTEVTTSHNDILTAFSEGTENVYGAKVKRFTAAGTHAEFYGMGRTGSTPKTGIGLYTGEGLDAKDAETVISGKTKAVQIDNPKLFDVINKDFSRPIAHRDPTGESDASWPGASDGLYDPVKLSHNDVYANKEIARFIASCQTFGGISVLFDANGGTPKTTSLIVSSSGDLPVLPHVDNQEKGFLGWYGDRNGGKKLIEGVTMFTRNKVVFAMWTGVKNIIFDTNGGDTASTSVVTNESGYITAWPSDPVKAGYTFAGWYDDPTAGNAVKVSYQFVADRTVTRTGKQWQRQSLP